MPEHAPGTRLMLPLEVREHARPCPACQGSGVTGERYTMPAGQYTLALDVLCPSCGGCGNGDANHPGCEASWHASNEPDDYDPYDPDDEDEDSPDTGAAACFSCQSGRGWWPMQGFAGEGDDTVMYLLRVPCGCSQDRLVEAADA